MPTPLPQPLAAYFAAVNARDIECVVSGFAAEAVVRDEGEEHRGLDAIRDWMMAAIKKYDFAVEPTHFAEVDGRSVVTGTVSGSFPGGPVSVKHSFTLRGRGSHAWRSADHDDRAFRSSPPNHPGVSMRCNLVVIRSLPRGDASTPARPS